MKEIELTQGQVALVDDWNYEWLNRRKWFANKSANGYYAVTKENGEKVQMQNKIMKPPKGMLVDHIYHNTLDYQECNLRLCTRTQNNQNRRSFSGTSKYKGVSWYKTTRKWVAHIRVNKKLISLGYFTDEHLAATIYNAAATKYFGEFSCLNEVPEEYTQKLNEAYKILEGEKLCGGV